MPACACEPSGTRVLHQVAAVQVREMRGQPVGHDLDQPGRPQLADLRNQRVAHAIALADDDRTMRRVVEHVAQLRLDDRSLLLDHHHLAQAAHELAHAHRLDRVGEAELEDANAMPSQRLG